jgi:Legionella pneumophila major outer membrane protein precursor
MDWCDMCGDFEFGLHALVFSPIACEYDYATTAEAVVADNTYRTATTHCELDWGFRVFGRMVKDCNFIGVSYQWFESRAKDSSVGLGTVRNLSGIVANKAEAALRLEYQNLDVRLGKYIHRVCGCDFYLFGNARWVDLRYNRHTRGVTIEGLVFNGNEKSTLEGGAIGVGGGAEYDMWCDVGLFGDLNLLGVVAQRSTNNVFAPTNNTGANNTSTKVAYASDTCINPEIDFRIGINYTYTCGCWSFVGELGYELDYFWNAFAFPRGDIGGTLASRLTNRFRECEDVGFSGLFFGGRFLF